MLPAHLRPPQEPVYKRGEHGQVARALRILDELRGYRQGRTLTELAAERSNARPSTR